jgi:hypothetical protein
MCLGNNVRLAVQHKTTTMQPLTLMITLMPLLTHLMFLMMPLQSVLTLTYGSG